MDDRMNIQWYPGHMTKTRRNMEADLKLVDAVCEIVDARIPFSSRNPDIDAICGQKPRMMILNRIDLADPAATDVWQNYWQAQGMTVVRTDCKSRRGIDRFVPAVRSMLAEKLQRYADKGQTGRALKLMIVGIPNVGKSTFINQIAGRKGAKAENRPGVTRGKQWVTVDSGLLLLDTPGIPGRNSTMRRSAAGWPIPARSRTTYWMWKRWPAIWRPCSGRVTPRPCAPAISSTRRRTPPAMIC